MLSTTFNKLSKLNDSIIIFLENPVIKYGFLILVILQIITITSMSTRYLEIYDNNIVKIVYAFLIAYYACFDPIYAIALTTLMIISIQELHSRKAMGSMGVIGSNNIHYNNKDLNLDNTNSHNKINIKQCNKVSDNDAYIYNEINKHALQKTPDVNDSLIAEYDYKFNSSNTSTTDNTKNNTAYSDPAFKTLTGNIEEERNMSKYQIINSDNDLMNIESNVIQGVNQNTSNQPFHKPILNIQGLPFGYDPKNIDMRAL